MNKTHKELLRAAVANKVRADRALNRVRVLIRRAK